MERWEKKYLEELRVKQVDKVVQTVRPVPVEVSPVGVQTDKVEPVASVVVVHEGLVCECGYSSFGGGSGPSRCWSVTCANSSYFFFFFFF